MPRAKVGSSKAAAIERAAAKYHVPVWILVGIYGIETSFGANVTTSSAGAVGPFQFLPSTWAQYGHGNVNNFNDAAMGAAHLLSALHSQGGSWDYAVQHYSGGGYDLAAVRAKAGQAPHSIGAKAFAGLTGKSQDVSFWGGFTSPFNQIPGAPTPIPGLPHLPGTGGTTGSILGFPQEIISAFRALYGFLNLLTQISFWIRVGEALAGMILIHMGLKNLSTDYAGAASNLRRRAEEGAGAAAMAAAA